MTRASITFYLRARHWRMQDCAPAHSSRQCLARTPASITRAAAALLLAFGLALASPAHAHDAAKGPHGGQQVSVQDKHLELTTEGSQIAVYVTDAKHDPITLAGASGKAVVQMGGKTSTVALASADGNRLVGKADTPIMKGARIVVSASLAGGVSLQARFVAN